MTCSLSRLRGSSSEGGVTPVVGEAMVCSAEPSSSFGGSGDLARFGKGSSVSGSASGPPSSSGGGESLKIGLVRFLEDPRVNSSIQQLIMLERNLFKSSHQ